MSPNLLMLSLMAIMHQMNAQSIDCNGDCECPSTSEEDTCTLNCHGTDRCKDGKLQCRSGDKCIIDCDGDNSCSGNTVIDASVATDVIVSCIGIDACKGNTIINCGTKSCAITCDSSTSCEDTIVKAPFATSLQCTGSCNSFKSFPTITVTVTTSTSSTNIPVHTTTLIQRLNPTTSPTLNPSLSPTFNPTKTQTIATTEPAISTTVVYTTKQQTEIPLSVDTTKKAEISTTDADVYTTMQQTDDSIYTTPESTLSNSNTFAYTSISFTHQHTDSHPTTETANTETSQYTSTSLYMSTDAKIDEQIVYNMASNPMWYFVIASAALIIIGSVFCCFGLFFYYKARTKHVAVVQYKDPPEANIGVKAKEAGTETTYKDADTDANVDGYGDTMLETKDGGDEDTMHDAYMRAEAVCGVSTLPRVAQYPMNMMMPFQYQRSIPFVNMASHLPSIPPSVPFTCATTPSGPENIFVDDIKKISVSTVANDGDIDNINNDVSTTNDLFKIDIHESDSTGELSSCTDSSTSSSTSSSSSSSSSVNTNTNTTLETKDSGDEDTMHEAYIRAEAVYGVNIRPPVAQYPMNMMMPYTYQRSIPFVNMTPHLSPIPPSPPPPLTCAHE